MRHSVFRNKERLLGCDRDHLAHDNNIAKSYKCICINKPAYVDVMFAKCGDAWVQNLFI